MSLLDQKKSEKYKVYVNRTATMNVFITDLCYESVMFCFESTWVQVKSRDISYTQSLGGERLNPPQLSVNSSEQYRYIYAVEK